jgi:hypothetical protein
MADLGAHIWGMKTIDPPVSTHVITPHVHALSQIGAQRDWMTAQLDQLGAGAPLPFTFAHHPRGRPVR